MHFKGIQEVTLRILRLWESSKTLEHFYQLQFRTSSSKPCCTHVIKQMAVQMPGRLCGTATHQFREDYYRLMSAVSSPKHVRFTTQWQWSQSGELKSIEDLYPDVDFTRHGHVENFSDKLGHWECFLGRTNTDLDCLDYDWSRLSIKNIHLEQTLNWHLNQWFQCWKCLPPPQEGHMSRKEIQSINHIDLP